MTPMLETMSWIATIVAVPVAVMLAAIGRSVSGKRKTNSSIGNNGGTAISGDVRVNEAAIVTGHNSPVNVSLMVGKNEQDTDRSERRYPIFEAVGTALNEALSGKMISPETFQSFSKAVTDSRLLLDDDGLVACLESLTRNSGTIIGERGDG